MKKGYVYLIIIIIVFCLAILGGIILFKKESKPLENKQANNSIIENKVIGEENSIVESNEISVEPEEKISPKALMVLQTYYKACGHTIKQYVAIPEEVVNMTQKELQEKYQDWEIKEFTSLQITLQKEEIGWCKQHYVLKEREGTIAIYSINEQGEEELKEETEIYTQYLPPDDLAQIQKGIKVYGQEELNSVLEDFE